MNEMVKWSTECLHSGYQHPSCGLVAIILSKQLVFRGYIEIFEKNLTQGYQNTVMKQLIIKQNSFKQVGKH